MIPYVEVTVGLTKTGVIWAETTVLGEKRKLQRSTKDNVYGRKMLKKKKNQGEHSVAIAIVLVGFSYVIVTSFK